MSHEVITKYWILKRQNAEQAAKIARLNDALDEARDSMLCAISAGAIFAPFWGWLEDGVEAIKKAKEAGR